MYKCQNCKDLGFVTKKNKWREEVAHVCNCRKQKDIEMILETKLIEANINKRFSRFTFEDYCNLPFSDNIKKFNNPQVNKLQEFVTEPGKILEAEQVLWLWGRDPNAGHTTLAVILAVALIKSGYRVKFFKMQDLVDAFFEFDKKAAYFADLKKFDVYILDDAFVADRSAIRGQYTKAHLFNFIDNSLTEDKHFIMTSDKLVESVGSDFNEIKMVLKRSLLELEFRGSIIEVKEEEEKKKKAEEESEEKAKDILKKYNASRFGGKNDKKS